MADRRQSEVLGGLPRTRPHRRSAKRPERPGETPAKRKPATSPAAAATKPTRRAPAARAAQAPAKPRPGAGPRAVGGAPSATRTKSKADRLRQPPQPRGIPSQPRSPVPSTPQPPEILGTFIQAAAELTEIGLALGAQVLRRTLARLPRP